MWSERFRGQVTWPHCSLLALSTWVTIPRNQINQSTGSPSNAQKPWHPYPHTFVMWKKRSHLWWNVNLAPSREPRPKLTSYEAAWETNWTYTDFMSSFAQPQGHKLSVSVLMEVYLPYRINGKREYSASHRQRSVDCNYTPCDVAGVCRIRCVMEPSPNTCSRPVPREVKGMTTLIALICLI